MKKISIVLAIITGILFCLPTHEVKAQSSEEAADYFGEVTDAFKGITRDTWRYLKSITRGKKKKKVIRRREKLLDEIIEAKEEVREVGSFQGDKSFMKAVLEYLDVTEVVLKRDYDKIMDMEKIAEQSYDKMEAYLKAQEEANKKLQDAQEEFQVAQQLFADKYEFKLVKEQKRINEKIQKASKAIGYYNDVYLIFFKVYKQEAYVLDALKRDDLTAFEQNVSSLKKLAEEGLKKLKDVDSYKGDASLKIGVRKMLKFYKDEAENKFPIITDFYVKKDNMEKIKKNVEAKSKNDRTKQDVEKYNKSVKEYNRAVKKYRKVNESLNEKRSEKLENWQDTVDDFFDKHAD